MTYNTCLTHKAGSLVSSFVYLKKKRDGKRASHSECMLYILVLRFALAHKLGKDVLQECTSGILR